jgi:hypothetical protein
MINFSFCITSDLTDLNRVNNIIESIRTLKIPKYEILIISEIKNYILNTQPDIKQIYFDEDKSKKWITKKKNILAQNAQHENLVMMHDYFLFDSDWYNNFVSFEHHWDICSNAQNFINGRRNYTDWVTWNDPLYPRYTALCYDNWTRTKYMYISGGFYLVKKHVAIDNPLNESLYWGQAEDVEWSLRVRDNYDIKCNGHSVVNHCKPHRDMNITYRLQKC